MRELLLLLLVLDVFAGLEKQINDEVSASTFLQMAKGGVSLMSDKIWRESEAPRI